MAAKQPRDTVRIKALGSWLRRAREEAGLSQSELAAAASVPLASVQNWEQGRRAPSVVSLVDVACACGADLSSLAEALGNPSPAGPAEAAPRGRPRKRPPEES